MLFGLPETSRTWQWIAVKNTSRHSSEGALSSPDEVAAFVGIPFVQPLEDA